MGDYTLQQKLILLDKMKQDQERNRYAIGAKREKSHSASLSVHSMPDLSYDETTMGKTFGKIRFLFALFLFLGYLFVHFTEFSYKTFDAKTVESAISKEFSLKDAEKMWKNIEKNLPFL